MASIPLNIAVDPGSKYIKAACNNTAFYRDISVVSNYRPINPKEPVQYLCGSEGLHTRGIVRNIFPIADSIIDDCERFFKLLDHVVSHIMVQYYQHKKLPKNESMIQGNNNSNNNNNNNILFSLQPINPDSVIESMAEHCFEHLLVGKMGVMPSPLLTLLAPSQFVTRHYHKQTNITIQMEQRSHDPQSLFLHPLQSFQKNFNFHSVNNSELSGLVIESGHGSSTVTSISNGIIEKFTSIPIGGNHATQYLQQLLEWQQGMLFSTSSDCEILQDMKHKLGNCLYKRLLHVDSIDYDLPDGTTLTVTDEQYKCMEPLFRPELMGVESYGIVDSIVWDHLLNNQATMKPMQQKQQQQQQWQQKLLSNIILNGSTCRAIGFVERIETELNEKLMENGHANIPLFCNNLQQPNLLTNSKQQVVKKSSLNDNAEAHFASVRSLCALAQHTTFGQNFMISKQQYEEQGGKSVVELFNSFFKERKERYKQSWYYGNNSNLASALEIADQEQQQHAIMVLKASWVLNKVCIAGNSGLLDNMFCMKKFRDCTIKFQS